MAAYVCIFPLNVLPARSLGLNQNTSQSPSNNVLGFLRLPHPRTGIPSLFLPYESSPNVAGNATEEKNEMFLEVQGVSPPNPRSWFMDEKVVAGGQLLIMTPIDPAFLLIPILQCAHPDDGTLGTFRPADDIFEEVAAKLGISSQSSLADILSLTSYKCIRSALKSVCDIREITPEIVVYRFSVIKVVEYLRKKVERLVDSEAFESSRTLIRALAKDGLLEDGKESLLQAGRIRAACDLIAQYVPENIKRALLLSYDFKLLDAYSSAIQDVATTLVADTKETGLKTVDGKKRRPPKTSQGVEKLKKANVNGMAKLSSFFKKP